MAGRCPTIRGLKLDHSGQSALREIQKITNNAKALQSVVTGGSLIALLFNDSVAINFINVSTKDWTILAKALQGVTLVERHAIELVASNQLFRSNTGAKQRDFFKAIYDGCKP